MDYRMKRGISEEEGLVLALRDMVSTRSIGKVAALKDVKGSEERDGAEP